MRFPAGGAPHLVDNFEQAPLEKRRLYSNEQVYLTRESGLPTVFLAPRMVSKLQSHDDAAFSTQSLAKMWRLPPRARIVVFTGHPRPHEAAQGKWPAPWYKKAYKSVRPVAWLSEHWR